MKETYSDLHIKVYTLFSNEHEVVLKPSIMEKNGWDPEKMADSGKDLLSLSHLPDKKGKTNFITRSKTIWRNFLLNETGDRRQLARTLSQSIKDNYNSDLTAGDFTDRVTLETFLLKIKCIHSLREVESDYLIFTSGPKKQFSYSQSHAGKIEKDLVGNYKVTRKEPGGQKPTIMSMEVFPAKVALFEKQEERYFSVLLTVPSLSSGGKPYTYVGKVTEKREDFLYIVLSEVQAKHPDFSFLILHKIENDIGYGSMLTVQQQGASDGQREPISYENLKVEKI